MAYIGTTPTKVVSRQSVVDYRYTATAGQTAFTGADLNNQVLACNPADMDVRLNGVTLDLTDWTATATTLTLAVAATAGDEVTVAVRQTFEVADTYAKTTADDRFVNAAGDTVSGALAVTGDLTVDTNTLYVDSTNNNVGIGTSSPAQKVHVGGNIRVSSASENTIITNGANFTTGAVTDSAILYNSGSLLFGNGSTERIRIDSSGRVTMPYQPAIQISAMNVAVGSYSTGGTVFVQSGGMSYNSSTGAITVPVAGNYRITYAGFSSAANSYVMMSLRKNGGHYGYSECFAASNGGWIYVSANQTMIVNMSTSDYLQVYCNGGSPYTAGGGGNSLSMELIG